MMLDLSGVRRGRLLLVVGVAFAAIAFSLVVPEQAKAADAGEFCAGAPQYQRFTDLAPESAETRSLIGCLVGTGITQGATATTFEPGGSVTRRQMAMFIKRLADLLVTLDTSSKLPNLPTRSGQQRYSDVGPADPAAAAVDQLAAAGIVTGFADGTYQPRASVTRRQMATFIVRLIDHLAEAPTPTDDHFDDDAGDPAEAHFNALAELGIFLGDGAGQVSPGMTITRRQMAAILLRTGGAFLPDGGLAIEGVQQPFRQASGGGVIAHVGDTGLHVTNADGTADIPVSGIVGNAVPQPAMSPDGRKVAFQTHGSETLTILDIASGGRTHVQEIDGHPYWSYDGTKIAHGVDEVWTANLATDIRSRLWATDDADEVFPRSWMPDGRVLYTYAAGDCHDNLNVANVGAGDSKALTSGVRTWDAAASSTPDGRVVFVRQLLSPGEGCATAQSGDWSLFVMNADGSGVRDLGIQVAAGEGIATSPDGRLVLYRPVDGEGMDGPRKTYEWRLASIDGSTDVEVPFLKYADSVSWSKTVAPVPSR